MAAFNKLKVESSPLQLGGYFIRKLSFSISEDFERDCINSLYLSTGLHPQLGETIDEAHPHFGVSFGISVDTDDSSKYKFDLSVKSIKEANSKEPYIFEAEMVAYFTWVAKNVEIPNLEERVQNSAIALMYSTLREVLASATARSPIPALVLPSATFNFFKESNDEKPIVENKKLNSKPKNKTTKQLRNSKSKPSK